VNDSGSTSRAALALVILMHVLLLADAWAERSGQLAHRLEACPIPSAVASVSGSTVAVRCQREGDFHAEIRGPARLLYGLKLDLNRVNAAALEALPGVGPARAEAILRSREMQPFQTVEQLRNISGIGPVTLKQLRPYLMVDEGGVDESG
jgi:competence ComEA-like helix-hairpin-helix protein